MRVLMLGWAFAPYVSGGVGVACLGLTRALIRQGVDVLFVMPRAPGADGAARLDTPERHAAAHSPAGGDDPDLVPDELAAAIAADAPHAAGHVAVKALPNWLDSPYLQHAHAPRRFAMARVKLGNDPERRAIVRPDLPADEHAADAAPRPGQFHLSATDHRTDADDGLRSLLDEAPWFQYANTDVLYEHAMDYARRCLELARDQHFDVVHAHDWMSFPAAAAVAAALHKPMIAQFHSTEVDRCGPGDAADSQVFEFERRGIAAADRVIAVSRHAAGVLQRHYGCAAEKIDVVYNGVGVEPTPQQARQGPAGEDAMQQIEQRCVGKRLILFAGRITLQKGSRFFVEAAAKVLRQRDDVCFIMAGGGDQVQTIREQAIREGVGERVILPGFLAPGQLTRLFRRADVFVMPSVSEPFGLAALEAIQADVPVIVSNTSGIAEVASHVLKVDFWNTDEIAGKILAVLNSPTLAATMRENAVAELKQLSWDAAAQACVQVYQSV